MNGWSNRETWLINVHDFFGDGYFAECNFASVEEAEEAMREAFDEWLNEETRGMHPLIKDLIKTDIDWRELAEHYYNDWEGQKPKQEEE